MQSFNELVLEYNTWIHHQQFTEAVDRFYHPDIIAAVNDKAAVAGIDAFRKEVVNFIEKAQIDKVELVSLLTENNLSVTNWYVSMNHPVLGRIDNHVMSVQRWSERKIIQEHHFYVS